MGIVYRCPDTGSKPPAYLATGELAWAKIFNCLEHPGSAGKSRPVVLIESRGSQWLVMGLTTRPSYRDGSPRTPVPDPGVVGLRRAGHLWGRCTRVAAVDMEDHIGWADEALAHAIIAAAELPSGQASALRDAAHEHHRAARAGGAA